MRSLSPDLVLFFLAPLVCGPLLATDPMATSPGLRDEPFLDLTVPASLARAEKEGRVVVAFFHDPELADSRRMLSLTFGDANVQAWLNKHAVAVQVPSSDKTPVSRFGVKDFPMTLILRPDARVVHRIPGYVDAGDILIDLETALIGLGEVKKPEGETEESPIAWMAWGNWLFANAPERADECAEAYFHSLDKGESQMPGFRRRHIDFLLERLSYLKARSQDALDGIFHRRQDLRTDIESGRGTAETAWEYTRFNYWLRDQDETIDLFKLLGQLDTPEHDACRRAILKVELARIVDYRLYDDVLALIPDPLAHIDRRLRDYATALKEGKADTTKRALVIDDAAALYECLLHKGRGADAMELLERVTGEVPTGRAFFAFLERTNRLELYDLSRTIVAKGLKAVKGAKGKKMLEAAGKKIPDTSELGTGTTPIPVKGPKGGGDH
jgi:thioredoxin family protein